jgi:hypothetical protein
VRRPEKIGSGAERCRACHHPCSPECGWRDRAQGPPQGAGAFSLRTTRPATRLAAPDQSRSSTPCHVKPETGRSLSPRGDIPARYRVSEPRASPPGWAKRIDPESEALYREVVHECVAAILGDEASAEVFLLALHGLFADQPSMEVLEQRTQLLPARFAPRSSKKGVRP